jgi:beta-lactamase regulating signal transducer with metallopeptidase domain
MSLVVTFLVTNGPMLLLGVTMFLLLASAVVLLQKQPIHRQRVAEFSMLACLLWVILACIPLPRFTREQSVTPISRPKPFVLQPGDELIAAEVFKQHANIDAQAVLGGLEATAPTPPGASSLHAAPTDWSKVFATLYLCGCFACGLWMLLGNLLLRRLLMHAKEPEQESRDIFNSLKPNRKIRLLISDRTDRPISFGLFRPIILLPSRLVSNTTQLRHILLHELAHVSQRDAIGHFLFNLLFPLLYFHPLYWWLRQRTNLARELIADDLAAAFTSRESYAADLLELAKERFQRAALSAHALGLFQAKTDFYRRMHMLVARKSPLARECSIYWRFGWSTMLVVAMILGTGLLGVRRANAQNFEDEKNRDAEIKRLIAEQDAIAAKLTQIEVQKQQLQDELQKRRGEDFQKFQEEKARKTEEALTQKKMAEAKEATVKEKLAGRDEEKIDFVEKNSKKDPRAAQQNVMDFSGRAQLDLVSLANSYVNAVGELKIQELHADRFAKGGNNFSDTEKAVARVHVETANRKVQIFRSIAEAAAEAAKVDLEMAHLQFKKGMASRSAVVEAESRLRILQIILSN